MSAFARASILILNPEKQKNECHPLWSRDGREELREAIESSGSEKCNFRRASSTFASLYLQLLLPEDFLGRPSTCVHYPQLSKIKNSEKELGLTS